MLNSQHKKPIKSGLFLRIFILVSLLIACIVSVNTYLSIRRETDMLMDGLLISNERFVKQLSSAVKNTFLIGDWSSVVELVKSSVESEEIVYCRILKPDGEIFLADDKSLCGSTARDTLFIETADFLIIDTLFPKTKEKVKLLINPVDIGGESWSVWLAVSLKPINMARMRILRFNLIEGVLILILGALITILLSKSITNPMGQLVEGTRQVSNGNLDFRIDVKAYNEIEELAGAFNHMTNELKTSRDEIKSYSKKLEEMVEERTKKLRHEIIERKNAEGALRESEEKYRSLFENIMDGIFIIDKKTKKFLNCNRAALELYGYSSEELLTMTPHLLFSPDNRYEVDKYFDTAHESGPRIFRHITCYGKSIPVEILTRLIYYNDQKAFISIVRDINERVSAEEKSKRLELQLQRAQKMEAIGTLAGGVAHDLNNILSGLVSYPELLLMDLPKGSPLRKPILTMQRSGERAATIVQDLLTLARRGVLVKEPMVLNSIIQDYLKSPEHENIMMYHPGIEIKTRLGKDLLSISGSPVHLSKTIMNLVSNAAEAITGGGEILISTTNQYIDTPVRGYTTVEEGDYVILSVQDTGTGIAQKDIERIFEPFYTKKAMGRSGTGLGMAVVWGTVKDHGGYIDVQSIEGAGTTFNLYFPVTRQERKVEDSSDSSEEYKGNGESILIIDDVQEQREIASVMLKKLGYSVSAVASGEEGVDYLRENPVDLVVLDMIMDPGIDGTETYKRIIELYPGQKAVIVSGFSETLRVKEAQKIGAGVYVKKPYLLEKIGAAIRNELGNHRTAS